MITPSTSRISSRSRPIRWSPARPTPSSSTTTPSVALEDVDGDDVPADGADPAGHGTEGAGSVGQLHPDQVVRHRLRVGRECVGRFRAGYEIGRPMVIERPIASSGDAAAVSGGVPGPRSGSSVRRPRFRLA